ncbi:MAG: HrpE/YscL family type III secretion apparatus protein [Chlamydia sp.]
MTDISSSKFLSLIDTRDITVAPRTKIIPKAVFSSLISSKELLETVQKDAKEYRKQIVIECEELKAQAEKEGFEAGYNQWLETVRSLELEIHKVREELQKSVLPVALKAAQKIVHTELQTNSGIILDIVMGTLKTIAQHKKIVLYVSRSDYEAIETNKNKIKEIFEDLESFSVRERDDIEPGGCVVETEVGIINARLKERWDTLELAFQSLSNTLRGS